MKTIKTNFDDMKKGDWVLLSGLTPSHNVIGRVSIVGKTWLHKHPIINIDYLLYQGDSDNVVSAEVEYTKQDKPDFIKIVGDNLAE